ncbi:MAG TPA: hypothetical protein VGR21_01895, partial [Cryptosporangiaceae bacterium]|nr:hypothetical protein [Cryptosporangiaceae bacterium]
ALPELVDRPEEEFVVLAKSRDSLRLVTTDDPDLLCAELEACLEEYQDEPRQLSPVPYQVRDGTLAAWDPPRDHPCRPIVDLAQYVLAGTEYRHQQNVLQELFENTGENVFVATYSLVESDDQSAWSFSVWERSVTAALHPRTDFVVVGDLSTGEHIRVSWADLLDVTGDAFAQEPGYYPPLWRVNGALSDATLAALRRVAVAEPS